MQWPQAPARLEGKDRGMGAGDSLSTGCVRARRALAPPVANNRRRFAAKEEATDAATQATRPTPPTSGRVTSDTGSSAGFGRAARRSIPRWQHANGTRAVIAQTSTGLRVLA